MTTVVAKIDQGGRLLKHVLAHGLIGPRLS